MIPETSSEFGVLPCPPSSPDPNVIEHIWDVLQHPVRHRNLAFRNTTELWTALQEVWCSLPAKYYSKLVGSIPCRISGFVRSRVGPTKYYTGVLVFLALECKGESFEIYGPSMMISASMSIVDQV